MEQNENGAPANQAAEKPKRNSVAEKDYNVEEQSFSFTFADGTILQGKLTDFIPAIVTELALHGVLQKGGDSYAGVKGDVNAAKANCQEVIDNLKSGVFSAGGGGGPRLSDLAEAIGELKSVSFDVALEAVRAASDEDRRNWRAHPTIKEKIAEIALRKARAANQEAAPLQINLPV